MLKEILQNDFPEMMQKLENLGQQNMADATKLDDNDLCELSIAINKLIAQLAPGQPEPISRIAEAYHLRGELREAGKYYKKVLELAPPLSLTDMEQANVIKYAPVLHTTPNECFELMDVVAVHHPEKPLIAYHLFWEDDYNFPDDFEPCDHEQVWISYNPLTGQVDGVWAFFHSRVISTREAIEEANENGGKADIYIQWGTHGSLMKGWETLSDPRNPTHTIMENMKRTFHEVSGGGRVADHPLKRWWPKGFAGDFTDYVHFSCPIHTTELLQKKNKMIKSGWSNAVLQQYFLTYNFHPKFDWP